MAYNDLHMKRLITNSYILLTLSMLIFIHLDDDSRVLAQPAGNSIQNFRAVNLSDAELKVTIDYTYNGELGTSDVYIHATPEESGGVFDLRTVNYEEVTLRRGTNRVTLNIKKRPESRNFTSQSIRVCMSTLKEAILCEDFQYTKTWTTARSCLVRLVSPEDNATLSQRRIEGGKVETAWNFSWSGCPGATQYHLYVIGPNALNPIVDIDTLKTPSYLDRSTHYGITSLSGWTWRVRAYLAGRWGDWSETRTFNVNPVAPPAKASTCSISGRVTGKLQDQGFTVTHVGVFVPGEWKPRFTRQLDNQGRYAFEKLPGDQEFRVAPFGKGAAGWRYDRQKALVSCRAGKSFKLNLHILGVSVD